MQASPIIIIFITIFIDLVSFGIIIPLLPFFAQQFDASGTTIGALLSIFSLMSFIMMPVWGKLSDWYGRRPIIMITVFISVIAYIVFSFSNSLWMLFLSRILSGIGNANISVAQAAISDATTTENRAKGMGLIGAAFGLGFVFGPLIGGIFSADYFGNLRYTLPGWIAAGLSLLNLILAYFLLPESFNPVRKDDRPIWDFQIWSEAIQSNFKWMILLIFIVTIAFSSIFTSFPLFIVEPPFNLTSSGTGMFFMEIGIVSVIIQGGLIGLLSNRFGEKKLIFSGTLIMTLGFLIFPMSAWPPYWNFPILILSTFFIAMGSSCFTPSFMSLVSKRAPSEKQGLYLGVMQGFASLGRVIGPTVGGLAYDHMGHASPYYMAFGTMLLASVIAGGVFFEKID